MEKMILDLRAVAPGILRTGLVEIDEFFCHYLVPLQYLPDRISSHSGDFKLLFAGKKAIWASGRDDLSCAWASVQKFYGPEYSFGAVSLFPELKPVERRQVANSMSLVGNALDCEPVLGSRFAKICPKYEIGLVLCQPATAALFRERNPHDVLPLLGVSWWPGKHVMKMERIKEIADYVLVSPTSRATLLEIKRVIMEVLSG